MEKNKRVPRCAGNGSEDRGDPGAVVLKPEPPRRGTFTLLLPGDMCWGVTTDAGIVRLDFRPMTRAEKAEAARRPRELARTRTGGETRSTSTRSDEESGR